MKAGSPGPRQKPTPEGAEERLESPRHGFQGDRAVAGKPPQFPAGLTITLSREAGSRGNTIGNRVATRLGWPVYNQDQLEYVSQEGPLRQTLLDTIPEGAARWAEERLETLQRAGVLGQQSSVRDLARMLLLLGAQGEAVLIGRGGGCVLPPESTLNVRVVAPLARRVAYMSQWLRLSQEQAAERVRQLDRQRAEFLHTHYHRHPDDIYQYDLVLNSALLGEDLCAELMVQAALAKHQAYAPHAGSED